MANWWGDNAISDRLFSWAPKSLQMVTAAMKLKDACPLEEKLRQTSVQFSRSVVSDSLRPHGLQHVRPPCPSLTPKAYSNWCPSSVMPSNHLILCLPLLLPHLIFPSIRVFPNESILLIRWPKFGASASVSVLPVNSQDWFPLGWTGYISLLSKGLSRVFSNTTVQKHQFFSAQLSL